MTTANEEFSDLMPHIIKVTGQGEFNDYGRPVVGASSRTYRCLVEDATTTVRNAQGEELTLNLTVYVAPVPIESTDGEPVDIESTDKVEIVTPRPTTRQLVHVDRFYDSEFGVGKLHNIRLGFV